MYNPEAWEKNTIELTKTDAGCTNCDPAVVCKYARASVTTATQLTSITFISGKTGLSVVKTIGAYASNYHTLEELLTAIFRSEGYVVEGTDAINIYVDPADGTKTYYEFIGEAEVTLINALAMTKTCTAVSICEYKLITEGSATSVFTNDLGVSTVVDTLFSTESAADVDTAISALIAGEKAVDVIKNTTDEVFEITIRHYNNKSFSLDGTPFEKSNCVVDYEA